MIRRYSGNPSYAAPEAGAEGASGPRSATPPAVRRLAAGGPASAALPSSDWKDRNLILKEEDYERA